MLHVYFTQSVPSALFKKKMYSKFIQTYFLSLMYILHLSSSEESFHSVTFSDQVILSGCDGSGLNNQWNFNNKILYFGSLLMQGQFRNSVLLLENYTLSISHVNVSHEGVYECVINLTSAVTHYVKVRGLYFIIILLFTFLNS